MHRVRIWPIHVVSEKELARIMIKLGRMICSICYHNLPIAALYLVNDYHFENGGGGAVSTVPAVITVAVNVWVLLFFQLY